MLLLLFELRTEHRMFKVQCTKSSVTFDHLNKTIYFYDFSVSYTLWISKISRRFHLEESSNTIALFSKYQNVNTCVFKHLISYFTLVIACSNMYDILQKKNRIEFISIQLK